MDIASIIGLVVGAIVVVFGIVFDGKAINFGSLMSFYDLPSIIITCGGSLVGLLAMNSVSSFVNGFKSITLALKMQSIDESETIKKIIDLSNIARKEGLLQLEEAAGELEDQFMKKGILLIVDGTDPDLVRAILETELSCIEDRHKGTIGFWEDWASNAPAWGMIGTLIGLVKMLVDLDDPSSIGPAMAVALLTTLYGSLIANWIATPIAKKLSGNNAAEVRMKEVMIEGLLSIQAGENPRVIEEKLKSFLAPAQRDAFTENAEGGE